jgi:PAS domain S-box-containing protein
MEKSVLQSKKKVDILIVEDSPTQAEKLKYLLEKHHYNVITAENGQQALDVLEQYETGIIISDICMPKMDGYELCRRVKALDHLNDTPIILLTSLSNPEDVIEGLECGADNFITKPYSEDYLLSHVQQIIANQKLHSIQRVRIGVEILFAGKRRFITADQQQMLTLLISTYEAAVMKNKELLNTQEELQTMNDQLEEMVEERTMELKKNEQKYQDLYDNAPTMFLSVEYLTGKVLDCNETLLRKTGFNRSEIIGKHIFTRYHPDCMERAKESLQLFNEIGESKNVELELITKIGKKLPVLMNSTAVRGSNGKILHSRSVLQDISELKQVQEALLQAKDKANESDRLKTAFLANMSHEIRTPMNGILGFSQLLIESDLPCEEKEKYIDAIDKSTHQLLHIITDILDVSKIEAGEETMQPVIFNLNELLDEINNFFQPLANQRNLDLSFLKNFPPHLVYIMSDPVKLRQILNNIIGNALKFTEKGTVEIKVATSEQKLIFNIKDSGIGIDPSLQEVIFDRFRQVELTKSRKYGGTGLGLSLAKSYTEMLGGTIWVDAIPGIGSTFTFEIPLMPAIALGDEKKGDKKEIFIVNSWRNKTLLLVEDEEINCSFIQLILKSTGIHIITALNGLDAVEMCKKNNDISLVLMDIKMPEMDGITATRIIRSFKRNLPIIATTAYAFSGDSEKCIEAGCNDYISKPIKRDQLISTMNKYLS